MSGGVQMKKYSYILIRTMLGGVSNSVNRLVVNDLPMYPFLFLRYLGIAILSIFFNDTSFIKQDIQVLKHDKKARWQMGVTCLISMIGTVLFFTALKELPVSIVSIYENGIYAVLTVLLAVWILKEKLPKGALIYLTLCMIGLALIVTKGRLEILQISLIGILFLTLNALLSAINTTVEMYNLKNLSIFTITFLKSLMSSLLMLMMLIFSEQSMADFFRLMTVWLGVFFAYSIINSFAIKYLQLKSMKVLNSSKTAVFQLITPVFSTIFAVIIFKEHLNVAQCLGMGMIIYSVYRLK